MLASSECCTDLVWYSDEPAIASVNQSSGYIYAASTGTTRIYAVSKIDNSKKDYCVIEVLPPIAVTGISLCPESKKLCVGETTTLNVTVCPSNATNKRVTWCSSNENVACVNYYTGEITANMAGTTTITATTVDGGFQTCCAVTVCAPIVENTVPGEPSIDEEQENNPPSDGYIGNYADFLEVLGFRESTSNYSCISASGYLGMYQMSSAALIDAGFKDSNGNWTSLAASYGVTSNATFLSSPDAQEYAVKAYHKKIWGYLEYYDYQSILGRTYYGVIVTESGLLAAAHLVGAYGVTNAIKNNTNIQDGLGTHAYEYMDLMKNFDISEIK